MVKSALGSGVYKVFQLFTFEESRDLDLNFFMFQSFDLRNYMKEEDCAYIVTGKYIVELKLFLDGTGHQAVYTQNKIR